MLKTHVRRTIAALCLLAPFVLFQGLPRAMPAWLARPLLGIPGTVWLVVIAGYAGFVVLIWSCMRDDDLSDSP